MKIFLALTLSALSVFTALGAASTNVSFFKGIDVDNTVHNERNLGTIANGGTATLVLATNVYKAAFSGATATIALPTITITTNSYWFRVYGTNTSGGSQIITFPSMIRDELSVTTPVHVTTITNNTAASFRITFEVSGGVPLNVDASGDALSLGSGIVGTLINTTATVAGNLVKFTDTTKTNTAPASTGDIQAALGNVYQAINGTLSSLSTNTLIGTGRIPLESQLGTVTATNLGFGYINLLQPRFSDGTGTTLSIPTSSASTINSYQAIFSATAATNVNWCTYVAWIPDDLDTTVELVADFALSIGGADTAQQKYSIGFYSPANSAPRSAVQTGCSLYILFNFTDAAGASADTEYITGVTLTGWSAALTPGRKFLVFIARDGSDASSVSSVTDLVKIKYKRIIQ